MASPDDTEDLDYDIDAELDEWLDKMAAEQGLDPKDLRAAELEVIQRWQQNPTMDDFEWLYNSHQPLLNRFGHRYVQSATIPKNAVKSSLLRGYTNALQTYRPEKGSFSNHFVQSWLGRTGRYVQKYSNVGRIPEERAGLISIMQSRLAELTDQLGRAPSDAELADDMLVAVKDYPDIRAERINLKSVGTLRKELRQDRIDHVSDTSPEVSRASELRRQIVFLHGSLNPEQQLVLEHTFEEFGKPVFEDPGELGRHIGMSPQKIRAIRAQIQKKVQRYY